MLRLDGAVGAAPLSPASRPRTPPTASEKLVRTDAAAAVVVSVAVVDESLRLGITARFAAMAACLRSASTSPAGEAPPPGVLAALPARLATREIPPAATRKRVAPSPVVSAWPALCARPRSPVLATLATVEDTLRGVSGGDEPSAGVSPPAASKSSYAAGVDRPLMLRGVQPGCHGPGTAAAAWAPTPPMAPPPRRTCMGCRLPGVNDSDKKPPSAGGAPGAACCDSSIGAASLGRCRPGVRSRKVLLAASRKLSSTDVTAPRGPPRDNGGGTDVEPPRREDESLLDRPRCCSRDLLLDPPSLRRDGAGDGERSVS